jgi:hypothetical protein
LETKKKGSLMRHTKKNIFKTLPVGSDESWIAMLASLPSNEASSRGRRKGLRLWRWRNDSSEASSRSSRFASALVGSRRKGRFDVRPVCNMKSRNNLVFWSKK